MELGAQYDAECATVKELTTTMNASRLSYEIQIGELQNQLSIYQLRSR